MKKLALAASLLSLTILRAGAQGTGVPPTPSQDLAFFEAQFPRTEGSAGERAALARIAARLEEIGEPFERQSLSDLVAVHSYSSSIEAVVKGARPDELLVVVSLDQGPGASRGADGSINLALALRLIEVLRNRVPPITVRFLFLGAQSGEGPAYPIGSRQFLANYFPDHPVAVLYLSFRGVPSRVLVTAGGRRIIAPYWLINRVTESFDRSGLFYLLRGNQTQIFRLGLIDTPPAIDPFLEADYPSIELSDAAGAPSGRSVASWAETFERFFREFLELNSGGFVTTWDRHYLFFQARFFSFILTEEQYVLLLLAVLSLALLYPLVFKERFERYLGALVRHLPSLPLLLAVVFVFLFLSTLLLVGITLIRNFPTLWQHAPFLFFALKVLMAVFLLALLFRILRALPFARSARFYDAAVVFLLLVDIAVLALIDISLTYYLLWAFMWALLFVAAPWRLVKALCMVVSTAWLVKAAVDIFSLPALDAIGVVLLSRVRGNLLIALNILPFLLMVIRLDFLFRRDRRRRRRAFVRIAEALLGAGSLALALYLCAFAPYDARHPQPVTVRESVDLTARTRSISLSSPAPIRGVTFKVSGNGARTVTTRSREYSAALAGLPEVLSVEKSESTFLDRREVDLTLRPVGEPSKVLVTLASKQEIVIFDSNFPFSYDPTSNTARILIGRNPPFPLPVQFTLSQGSAVEITIELRYDSPPYPIEVTGKNIQATKELVVRERLALSG